MGVCVFMCVCLYAYVSMYVCMYKFIQSLGMNDHLIIGIIF